MTADTPISAGTAGHARLTPAQDQILRQHGTERPGSSPLNAEKRPGQYRCVGCDRVIFRSDAKYESGSGWPSFWQPVEGAVAVSEDHAHGMRRVEVHCGTCQGHLGHVFEDGPPPTGLRYCINGTVLKFVSEAD